MLTIIAGAVVVLIAIVLAYAATRPRSFRYQRSIEIAAPPERIYPHVIDFRRWAAWSPYEKIDPAMKKVHRGPPSGVGAVYEWEGNGKAGKGQMEITQATPPRSATIRLTFDRPFKANNIVEFLLEPRNGSTRVTWAMHGPSPYLNRLMGVFINMDKMLGKDFEAGLTNLKAIVEQQQAPVSAHS